MKQPVNKPINKPFERKRWNLENIYQPLFIEINGEYRAVDRDRYVHIRISVDQVTTLSPRRYSHQ